MNEDYLPKPKQVSEELAVVEEPSETYCESAIFQCSFTGVTGTGTQTVQLEDACSSLNFAADDAPVLWINMRNRKRSPTYFPDESAVSSALGYVAPDSEPSSWRQR